MNTYLGLDEADRKLLASVKFDSLGPIIINSDGTLSRIPTWDTLTDAEKVKTVRLIAKRNKLRREALTEQMANNSPPSATEEENTTSEVLPLTYN